MSSRRQPRVCAYCGATTLPLTRDHVPAQNLFLKPLPSNLIAVPQCVQCKKGLDKDEEYFAVAILCDASQYSRDAAVVLRQLYPDIATPGRKRLADRLQRSSVVFDFVTEGGIYLGGRPMLALEVPRVNRVLEKIVRGLYFDEQYQCVPSGTTIRVVLVSRRIDQVGGGCFRTFDQG